MSEDSELLLEAFKKERMAKFLVRTCSRRMGRAAKCVQELEIKLDEAKKLHRDTADELRSYQKSAARFSDLIEELLEKEKAQ